VIATRIVWLLDGIAYFFPDVAKLLAGPEWVFSDNVKILLCRFLSDRRREGSPESRRRS
jgi:hypothetical protein